MGALLIDAVLRSSRSPWVEVQFNAAARTFPVGIVGTSKPVDARHLTTPLAYSLYPITNLRPFPVIPTHNEGVMDSSTWFDDSFRQSETVDIDVLVNAALCARTGTYVFPLTQTMCDGG